MIYKEVGGRKGGKRDLLRLSICLSVSFEINLLLTLLINAGSFAV